MTSRMVFRSKSLGGVIRTLGLLKGSRDLAEYAEL